MELPPTVERSGVVRSEALDTSAVIAGRYRPSALLGRGSFGEVWEADDLLTGEIVAVKLLDPGLGERAARLRREVATLRMLRVPGVVRLFDEGVDGGRAFVVTELVRGSPFPGGDSRGARTWTEIEESVVALLETLTRVHAAGVVHRDLKPANVLVDSAGRPTILDFGLAHLLSPAAGGPRVEGRMLGTPAYLAPEQARGEAVTPRADLYAVGVMLYQTLAGRLPHVARDLRGLLRARLTQRADPLGSIVSNVTRNVTQTVDALLALAPEDRPGSAEEVLHLLRGEARSPVLAFPGVEVAAAPVREEALRALFSGPDRLLHLREDAARLLFERTKGASDQISAALGVWERAGLVRRDRSLLVIDRESLDALSDAPPERLFRLITEGDEDDPAHAPEVVRAAHTAAKSLVEAGHLGRAMAALEDGLGAAQRARTAPIEPVEALLGLWVEAAIADATPRTLDRALYALCRTEPRSEHVAHLEQLVRAALAFRAGERGHYLVEEVAPFDDPGLERARQGLRAIASRRRSIEEETRVHAELQAWADASADTTHRAACAGWLGRLRYRQGRFDEAAALQKSAAAGERWPTHRLNALLNESSALLEAFRPEEAAERAAEARSAAKACRHPFYEARAEWLMRSAAYRSERDGPPDLELLDAIKTIGVRDLEALAHLTEAAFAFRIGDESVAAALAEHARGVWAAVGDRWGALIARALTVACGAVTASEELAAMATQAEACPVPGIGMQVIGLLAQKHRVVRSGKLAHAWAEAIPATHHDRRMDVLTAREALAR